MSLMELINFLSLNVQRETISKFSQQTVLENWRNKSKTSACFCLVYISPACQHEFPKDQVDVNIVKNYIWTAYQLNLIFPGGFVDLHVNWKKK